MRNVAVVLFLAHMLLSCTTATPHENFKNGLQLSVGWSIDSQGYSGEGYPHLLLSQKTLQNSNLEYRYEGDGFPPCIHIFEVNPRTRIIVRADFEGTERNCYITP